MNPKKMLIAGAVAGSMTLGAGAGALLFTPSISSAQSTTTTTPDGRKALGTHLARGPFALDVAAKAIGITDAELKTELQGGKTIADVAKAHDVDPQKVIDALVADAKAKLAEQQADLPSRITALVNGEAPLGKHGPGGRGPGGFADGRDAVAGAIGITDAELKTELQGGKTIADVARAHDVDPQKVIDAVVAAGTKRIDEAVANGKLTADQATKLKANLSDRATQLVNNARPPFGGRMKHRPGPRGVAPSSGSGASTGYVTS